MRFLTRSCFLLIVLCVAPLEVRASASDARQAATKAADTALVSAEWRFWEPPGQPPADGTAGSFADYRWDAAQIVNRLYEPLRTKNPGYVSRTLLGHDASGSFPVYRYEFTPPSPEKTVILLGGTHGSETTGSITLARFMRYVAEEWQSHPQLAYLRWRVRVVIIPVVNPWGASQDLRSRTNANGVDINRNYDQFWSNGDRRQTSPTFRGAQPFSEAETRFVRETVLAYPDAVAFVDTHDTGPQISAEPRSFFLYSPHHSLPTDRGAIREVIRHMQESDGAITWSQPDQPYGHNWAAAQGLHAHLLEFEQGAHSKASHDGAAMTAAMRWYANVITKLAASEPPSFAARSEPFTRHYHFNSGSTSILIANTSTFTEIEDFRDEFDLPGPGILLLEGNMVVGGLPGTVSYKPLLGQVVGGSFTADENTYHAGRTSIDSSSSRVAVPIHAVIPVENWAGVIDGQPRSIPIRVGLFAHSTGGRKQIFDYNVRVTFIPAESQDRVRIFSAVGRGGTGAGAMQQVFP
jgi:hypothetical protein